ncbi:MAG: hypothetical protein ACREIA_18355 [Opitutaceae bacterium]
MLALIFYERLARKESDARKTAWRNALLALLVAALVLVTLAGHTGGILSYGEDYLPFF